jgi:CheY-like chemotaxis protein
MYQTAIIIDDSTLERFIAERVIKNSGFAFDTHGHSSASDALTWLQSLRNTEYPDVTYLDVQMPLMTGFDFLDQYLQLPSVARQKVKIIMMSFSLADEDFT